MHSPSQRQAEIRVFEASNMNWSAFIGRRALFYAGAEKDRAHGWVMDANGDKIKVRSPLQVSGNSGPYLFQLFAPKFDLSFVGKYGGVQSSDELLGGQEAEDIEFTVVSPLRRVPVERNARRIVSATRANLTVDGDTRSAIVEDVSVMGIGLLTTFEVQIGATHSLTVPTENGLVQLSARVVYCRPCFSASAENWRVGCSVEADGRVCQALWLKFAS